MKKPWRRRAAFGSDCLLILLYMGLLALISLTFLAPRLTLSQPWQPQLLGFMTLTLPVVLYFALSESLEGGTCGKNWLGLSVTDVSGTPLPLSRSLALEFTPWELAHTLGLTGSYVAGLFRDQPLYDCVAYSRVALTTVHSRRFA